MAFPPSSLQLTLQPPGTLRHLVVHLPPHRKLECAGLGDLLGRMLLSHRRLCLQLSCPPLLPLAFKVFLQLG